MQKVDESKIPEVFVKWFKGPYDPNNKKDKTLNYERIGYLTACNGGDFRVGSWGIQALGGGPFKEGLNQEEALELMQLSSFINGANLVNNNIWPYVLDVVKEWVEKTLKEFDEKQDD